MSKDKEQKALVPRLRFPEFRGMPGWRPIPLSRVLDYVRPDRYIVMDTDYVESGTPVLTANKSFVLGYTTETNGVFEDIPVIIFDDFTTDKKFVDFPFKVKSSAIKILKTRGNDQLQVVYELMNCIRFDPTQHKRYYISEYQHLAIPLPGEAEQQKIADCLGSLDDLIAAEGRKLEALREHKNGLMQQLFPREGETRPRLRFPELRDAGEWKTTPLEKMGRIITGKTPSTKELDLWGGEIPFITPTDISEKEKYQTNTARSISASASKNLLPSGSVVYTCIASIGKMAITVRPSVTNQQINAVIPGRGIYNEFLYYSLANMTSWIKTIPASSTLSIINKTEFSSLPVAVPPDEAEQHRIADCLASLDALIAAQAAKLDALRTHKRGLMQQLFPSPEGLGT